MSAASNAIGAIVRLIVDIIKAVLSCKKPDLSMGYDSQAAMLDQLFGKSIQTVKTQAEHVKTTRMAKAKDAVQAAYSSLGPSSSRPQAVASTRPTRRPNRPSPSSRR